MHRDEPPPEADGHQIDPVDADFPGQPPQLLPFGMVEGFDRGVIRDPGANLDEEPGAPDRADQVDLSTPDRDVASFDVHPVPLQEPHRNPLPRSPDVAPYVAHTATSIGQPRQIG